MNKFTSFMLIFFFINASFIVAVNPVSASELIEDSWNTKMSMSQARAGLGVVAVDGKIYAIGGYTVQHDYADYTNYQQFAVGSNERYDPKTDTWTTLEPMPTARRSFAIAAYEGKIYCIGGDVQTENGTLWNNSNVFEVYDIATDSWNTKTAIPFDGGGLHANVVDGNIFVFVKNLWRLYMYDPVADSWTQKASLPKTSGSNPGGYSVVIDNQIIFIHNFDGALRVLLYDPKTDVVWSRGKQGETGSSFDYAVAVATTGLYVPQKIYIIGLTGDSVANIYDNSATNVYDPVSNTWTTAQSLPSPPIYTSYRTDFGVAVIDDLLYVIGGQIAKAVFDPMGYIVLAEGVSTTEQYVPFGHKDAVPAPVPSVTPESSNPTTFGPADPSEPPLTYIIAVLAVTIVTFAMGSFFYFKKKKKEIR